MLEPSLSGKERLQRYLVTYPLVQLSDKHLHRSLWRSLGDTPSRLGCSNEVTPVTGWTRSAIEGDTSGRCFAWQAMLHSINLGGSFLLRYSLVSSLEKIAD